MASRQVQEMLDSIYTVMYDPAVSRCSAQIQPLTNNECQDWTSVFPHMRYCQPVVSLPSVMWSETVGLRTRPVSDRKKIRSWSWSCRPCNNRSCCVVKRGLVTLVVVMILTKLKVTKNFGTFKRQLMNFLLFDDASD